uniref:Ig-like domain-containing protein n=1 Tax=Gouania willdenowi TaxID=441366 RepID=A0A8C5I5K1_GOUWI
MINITWCFLNVKPIANMGEDEILGCYLYAKENSPDQFTQVSVTWERKGVDGLVYNYEDGAPQLQNQASQYKGRVHLFPEELSNGNGSLMLRSVRRSDEGEYVCNIKSAAHSGKISIHLKTTAQTHSLSSVSPTGGTFPEHLTR